MINGVKIRVINDLPIIRDYGKNLEENYENKLSPTMIKANFSGPSHLKELQNSCFKYKDDMYKYEFCPFSNMTQEDINSFYDSYKGILGIWGEWIIDDNQFTAMKLIEGNPCMNEEHRTTQVNFVCGNINALRSVKEPKQCFYEAKFETPLVCGSNSMVVYPRLPIHLQNKWDEVYTDYKVGIFTEKGYNNELRKIFTDAGFYLHPDIKQKLKIAEKEIKEKTCEENVEMLKKRISELELQLKMKMIPQE